MARPVACLVSPLEPSRLRPCRHLGRRGAFSQVAESRPCCLRRFTPGSLPRRRLPGFLQWQGPWHPSHAPAQGRPGSAPWGEEEEEEEGGMGGGGLPRVSL